jgi:cation diffusion facilitator family transporter
MRAAHISIAGAGIIFLISLIVGMMVDSVTLLLDAGTGFVILFMAIFVKGILKKIANPPDQHYNFGYEKYESLTVALQNVAIIFTCLIGIVFAIQDIVHPEDILRYDLPVAATGLITLLSLGLMAYLASVARRRGSSMLGTAALHWGVDASMSLGMFAGFFIGLILVKAGYKELSIYVDPVMAIVLAVLVMRLPIKAFSGNVRELLDGVPSREIHEKITKVAEKHKKGFSGIHRMRVRKAGRRTFLDIGFRVEGDRSLAEVQRLAENFERELTQELPGCDVVVYFKNTGA